MGNHATNAAAGSAISPEPLAVDVEETARLLNIGVSTTWQYIAAGRIKATKIGRRRVVTLAEIKRVAVEGC